MNQRQQISVRHRFRLHSQGTQTEKLGALLPPPPEPLCRPEQLKQAQHLIVRRDAGLGDCLMILPTLGAIQQRFGHLQLTFQAPAAYCGLLAGFAEVDEAIPLEEKIDQSPSKDVLRVDLSNYMERHPQAWTLPRIDLIGTAFGITPLRGAARYHIPVEAQRKAVAWLAEHGSQGQTSELRGPSRQECRSYQAKCQKRRRLGIALRGIYGHRSWLIPYVFELARRLAAQNWEVLIFDGDAQAPRCPEAQGTNPGAIAYAYGLELPVVAALLASCDTAVMPDTGLLHLAACAWTPFVAIFGAVPPQLRLSHYQNYRCLTARGRVPCVPCCEGPQHTRCRYECIWAITPDKVEAALNELLSLDYS